MTEFLTKFISIETFFLNILYELAERKGTYLSMH